MKRLLTVFFVILISTVLLWGTAGDKKLFVGVTGDFLSPSDGDYKEIYGSSVFYPGFEAGFLVVKNVYLKAGYEWFSKDGATPVLEEPSESYQKIITFGAGYLGSFSDTFGFRIEVGGASFSYEEKAFGETVDGSAFGFFLNGGVVYYLSDSFYLSGMLGYCSASDDVNGVDIKLGGVKLVLGLGIRF